VDYGYPWSDLIARFKFQGDTAWARMFAGLMVQAPGALDLLECCDVVLPLPLTAERLGERGYNQSWLLARALGMQTPWSPAGKIQSTWLIKLRDTAPQHELDRRTRLRNLEGAFAVHPTAQHTLPGKVALLIDDILTTGATLRAAAQALKMAGAREVHALVFARTPAD